MKCSYRCCTNELEGRETRFCSPNCKRKNNIHVSRRKKKQRAVDYLGGKCRECGYTKCLDALQFHHKGDKDTAISRLIANNKPWLEVLTELKKCELLCANCHAEKHSGDVP